MSARSLTRLTLQERLDVVEQMVEELRWARSQPDAPEHQMRAALVMTAEDLRARIGSAPSVAESEIGRRIQVAVRSKGTLGYDRGALVGVAQELIGRWAVVQQALARFGALAEEER